MGRGAGAMAEGAAEGRLAVASGRWVVLQGAAGGEARAQILLENPGAGPLAFKVMVTAPAAYSFMPNSGFLEPGAAVTIAVTRFTQPADPGEPRDKIQCVSCSVAAGDAVPGGRPEPSLFSGDVHRVKLLMQYALSMGAGEGGARGQRSGMDVTPDRLGFTVGKMGMKKLVLRNFEATSKAYRVQVTDVESIVANPSVGVLPAQSAASVEVAAKLTKPEALHFVKIDWTEMPFEGGLNYGQEDEVFLDSNYQSKVVKLTFKSRHSSV